MNLDKLRNKHCLVTGGCGFIGSNLTEKLLEYGSKVTIIDDLSTGSESNLEAFIDNTSLEIIRGSVIDKQLILNTLREKDFVFHLAAFISVPGSFESPLLCQDVNVNGTLNILESAALLGVEKVVLASSSSVYGDVQTLPLVESLSTNPESPYAYSKLICEKLLYFYNSFRGLRTTSLRFFNAYGPNQSPKSQYAAVIPNFIHSISEGKSPTIYGSGKQSRDFVFVKDIVNALIMSALNSDSDGLSINIGSGESITIEDLAHLIISIVNPELKPTYDSKREGDIDFSLADISLAKEVLLFKPKFDINEGLKMTLRSTKQV